MKNVCIIDFIDSGRLYRSRDVGSSHHLSLTQGLLSFPYAIVVRDLDLWRSQLSLWVL
jgi:hypothetical protein